MDKSRKSSRKENKKTKVKKYRRKMIRDIRESIQEIHCPSTRDSIKKEKRKYRGRKSSEK